MANVVVTGGCGFVGSHLVDSLVRRGDNVVVFDSQDRPGDQTGDEANVRYVTGDIRDADQLARVITPGVDTVYHLAALVGVDQYLKRPLDVIDVNFSGTRAVLDLAVRADAKVVFSSTSEVFGKNPDVPWTEDADRLLGSTTADRWSYATSKALSEHLTFAFMRQHGLNASIIRYFNLYGPRQRPAFLVSRSVHRALRGIAPVVYDQGRQTRSFTYVEDAIDATVTIGASTDSLGECFNVGSSDEVSIRAAVELVIELTGLDIDFDNTATRAHFGDAYQDLDRRVPDTTKMSTRLGWKSTVDLRDGITRFVDWARANPWWLEQPDSAPK
ncbi:NAD-dependent epimerase/dehydratase family protein [Nocardiopsis ansamitocini]|uniref:UDP-glucose 4-epimerase n=1 Tax=Nocardiopsis ansamitocini TaxID=1670832 RepID=A0A9W6UKW2_9ACTN|nr:NAD-dependent epimerase/dehydratase family protein [Nocardiopsis ansamitocini]GLU50028.1 UDP-glucose 4-epimerase [Nocardiopsis ansamitocini]